MLHTESKIVFTKLNTVCLVYGCILYGQLYLLNNILHILTKFVVYLYSICVLLILFKDHLWNMKWYT